MQLDTIIVCTWHVCSSFSAGFCLVAKKLLVKKTLSRTKQRNNITKKNQSTVTTAKMKQLFLNFAICFLILHWMNCYEPNKSLIALFVLFLTHLTGLSPPQPNMRRFLVKVRAPFFTQKWHWFSNDCLSTSIDIQKWSDMCKLQCF